MKTFSKLSDLAKHVSKNGLNVSLEKILASEGERLKRLIQKYIDLYYASYKPISYKRTYKLKNAIRIDVVKQVGNALQLKIYFDDKMTYHESIFGDNYADGYVIWLIENGHKWKKNSKKIYRLSYYEGFHPIKKAIAEFNRTNKYGFEIKVTTPYGGRYI